MRLALEMLGLGPCHHMFVLIQDPSQQALWDTYPKGATPDWDQAFSGFQSAVDWPSTYYWQDIARHYPDAKVLLTLRSAESWWASYSNTVLNHITSLKGSGSWVDNIITQTIMQGHPDDRDTAIAAFNANNAQVRALVPRERLVVHELAHTAQYERLGGFKPFLKAYLEEWLTVGYPNGPLEQEAKQWETKILGSSL